MGLFRSRPALTAEVALHSASRASVRVAGRDLADEPAAASQVRAALGCVAVAHHRTFEARLGGFEECLVELAQAVAALGDGPAPERMVHLGPLGVGDFLLLDTWADSGRGRVVFEIVSARAGREVPRLGDSPSFAGPSVEIAALAVAQHVATRAAPTDDLRVALALGIEGIVSWYREAHRMSPPHDALAFALAHLAERLAESGRRLPDGFD
jgi:hypothetical protein